MSWLQRLLPFQKLAFTACLAALGFSFLVPIASAGQVFVPPVDGAIVDPWRPGNGPYSSGNRGVDFASIPGETVRAVAAGTVSFSGQVGGVRWVVIRHADNLRTSVGPMAELSVTTGQAIQQGQVVGTAAGKTVHLGLRRNDEYLDPTPLLQVKPTSSVSPSSTLGTPTTRIPGVGTSRVRLTK
jgi:murein DD-endopeptidase MepM/ murein hydrolase activator NlpD